MRERQRLSYLANLVTDRILDNKDPDKRYIGLEHIPSCGVGFTEPSTHAVSVSINGVFRAGDVLFGKLRPQLRKSIRASFGGYCSTDILILRPTPQNNPDFVSFALG